MKKSVTLAVLLIIAIFFVPAASAQSNAQPENAAPLRSQSINGSTGLYSIPSGGIGWENAGKFGLDAGYRSIINNDNGISHIPAITISLFKWAEISSAFDIQPDINIAGENQKNSDLVLGLKIKLPTNTKNVKNPVIALGGNFQFININNDNNGYNAYQPYIAVTYIGSFFNMSAETTVVFGKTLYSGGPDNDWNFDFGMGFDLILFPDVFGSAVHWIIDFANFGYSDNSWANSLHPHTGSAWNRGNVNTGIRVNLAAIPAFSRFKFALDLAFNDLLDDGARSFTAGVVFGFAVK
ncbi:MAG: hypothetical protein LBH16_05965 [Treponema sp.]|jgi:hypothetical protein|nr:hypothetical protein [Treponema sp.]